MLSDYHRYRLYEILPGLSIWLTLLGSVALSYFRPLWMIYFILLFDIYWLLRVINFSFYLLVAWRRFHIVKTIDWQTKLRANIPTWKEKKHLIFFKVYDEEWGVVRTALQSVAVSLYEKSVGTIVLAGEERKREHFHAIFAQAKKEFGQYFGDMVATIHPANLSDEIPGKGSNLHYAEKEMKKYIDARGWNYDDIIVTVFDIDTVCHPQYFAYLTYLYSTHPHPTRSSYQPVALYNNNMWDSPAVLRVMAFGTTFWMLTSLARQDSLVTFSSHSMSWRALADAGFHDKRIVSEDSRIFYQCLLAYDGDYEVTPMYIPVSMDTVRDASWWESVKNLYRQQRRWAWGAEHIPYLLWEFRKKGRAFPLWKKIKWVFVEWEGKWSWCMIAILITILGRLPMYLAPESVRQSALYFNAPHILETLMNIAMFGLLLSAVLSFPLLPRRPDSHPPHRYITHVLQWLLLPISLFFLGALPAIDAVTHMMRGRYLGFNVSQKKRVTP